MSAPMHHHRILAIGDSYMSADVFTGSFSRHELAAETATIKVARPSWDVEQISEYEGDPAEVAHIAAGYDIIAVHAAPITAEVLDRLPELRLIGCARGGPVNIDLRAARTRGVRVTTTPGKNAQAVADLTIGFLVSILRNVPTALDDVRARASRGRPPVDSAFDGARWFGHEVSAVTLGLIGYGNVARLVDARARALGAKVVAYDPFVDPATVAQTEILHDLGDLLSRSDVVSVHARATADNRHMIGHAEFGRMKRGSYFINTARESLVDEAALLAALEDNHLAGVALDVNEPDGPWRRLVGHSNLILTPHIAGATYETLARGADMLASEFQAFIDGRDLRWER